jgi:hypothetical protein
MTLSRVAITTSKDFVVAMVMFWGVNVVNVGMAWWDIQVVLVVG